MYRTEALHATYELSYKPNQLKAPSSFNSNPFIKMLQNKFGKCGGVYIKNAPWSYYDWHTDIGRQCSINWVIKTNARASTLYRTKIEAPDGQRSIMYDITEVNYTQFKPTILDTTKEHCVINPSDEDRIIFSLSIDAPFQEVKEYLCGLKLI
jgi:hypothetical protein